jgi:hypothetical protein
MESSLAVDENGSRALDGYGLLMHGGLPCVVVWGLSVALTNAQRNMA